MPTGEGASPLGGRVAAHDAIADVWDVVAQGLNGAGSAGRQGRVRQLVMWSRIAVVAQAAAAAATCL
eukprot:3005135-Alexandrium_andersonii.AAC.1